MSISILIRDGNLVIRDGDWLLSETVSAPPPAPNAVAPANPQPRIPGSAWQLDGLPIFEPRRLFEQMEEAGWNVEQFEGRCNQYVMRRGYGPGMGCVLMLKRDLDSLSQPQDLEHRLTISDGVNGIHIDRLAVVKTEAIFVNITDNEVTPTTPYLVTLADGRYYAKQTHINEQFSLRLPHLLNPLSSARSYRSVLSDIWSGSALSNLAPLSFSLRDYSGNIDSPPEDLRFYGMCAYDAFWTVLELGGLDLTFDAGGRAVVFSKDDRDETNEKVIEAARKACRVVDSRAPCIDPVIPKTVKVMAINANYQWAVPSEDLPNTILQTSGDRWTVQPVIEVGEFNFKRTSFNSDLIKGRVIADLEHTLWTTIPAVWNDRGQWVNEQLVKRHAENIAGRYANRMARIDGKRLEYEFMGVVPVSPYSWYNSVRFSDEGAGITTETYDSDALTAPNSRSPGLSWDGEQSRHGPPSTRARAPYGREGYGVLRVGTAGSPGENGDKAVLEPNLFGLVELQAGRLSPIGVDWFGSQQVLAVNGTGRPIRLNRRVYMKWNYQLGTLGAWVIVATGGDEGGEPDWTEACIRDCIHVERGLLDPGLVTVNKRRMLRICKDADQKEDESAERVIVDYQWGPTGSVLWTGSSSEDSGTIHWTTGPQLTNVYLDGWLKFTKTGRTTSPGIPAETQSWLGPPKQNQNTKIRLPGRPNRSHAYLIAAASSGGCTELGWHGPGLDCSLQVADQCFDVDDFLDNYFCAMVYYCTLYYTGDPIDPHTAYVADECTERTLTWSNGLLSNVIPAPAGCRLPSQKFGVDCSDVPDKQYNPCEDGDDPNAE